MIFLLAVLLAQPSTLNLNQQPIVSRQNGGRLSTTRQYAIDCRTNMTCTVDGGVLLLSSSGGGGGGSVNTSTGSVYFDGGTLDARATVTASWATGASVITCAATGEEASVEGLVVTVLSKASGSFVVRAEPRNGTHRGALPFECIGN